MKQLPEFIKYRAQCTFILGLTLITPAATLLLEFMTFDYQAYSNYNVGIGLFDLVSAFVGLKVLILTHHYLRDMEIEYAKQYSE